jgi:hypothetical protein
MTHTNFQKLLPTEAETAEKTAEQTAELPADAPSGRVAPRIPQQRSGDHDYFDAYADVHALMLELAAAAE